MRKTRLRLISVGVFLSFIIISSAVAADKADYSICNELTGAAWGLCRGGVAAGCSTGNSNSNACKNIEQNYLDISGKEAPWITPPVTCPCDYMAYVLIDEDWDGVELAGFNCTGDQASFGTILPLPQMPKVTAIRTTNDGPVCQAVTFDGGMVRQINEEELAACRQAVIKYGLTLMAASPSLEVNDMCSPLLAQ